MYIKLLAWKSLMTNVWTLQATLYDTDGVKTRDLDINDVVLDMINDLRIEIEDESLLLTDTND